MTDLELAELAIRRTAANFGGNLGMALERLADELAALIAERPRQSQEDDDGR